MINVTFSSSLKFSGCLNVSQRISARALKCSKQILSRELSPIVCSTSPGFLSRMKSISRIRQSRFSWHFFKTESSFRSSGFEISWQPFTCAPTAEAHCHPSIHFTMEIADSNKLPFLGMMIEKKGCKLVTSRRIPKTNEQWSPFTLSEPRGYALQEIID